MPRPGAAATPPLGREGAPAGRAPVAPDAAGRAALPQPPRAQSVSVRAMTQRMRFDVQSPVVHIEHFHSVTRCTHHARTTQGWQDNDMRFDVVFPVAEDDHFESVGRWWRAGAARAGTRAAHAFRARSARRSERRRIRVRVRARAPPQRARGARRGPHQPLPPFPPSSRRSPFAPARRPAAIAADAGRGPRLAPQRRRRARERRAARSPGCV